MTRSSRLLLATVVVFAATGCDQASKFQAVGALTDTFSDAVSLGSQLERFLSVSGPRPTGALEVVSGFWDLRYVENPGAAFSFLGEVRRDLARPLLLALSLIGVGWLFLIVMKTPNRLVLVAAALVMGGGLGNIIDRARLGYVIDFVHWHWLDHFHWPIFNMADVAISVGGTLLLVLAWQSGSKTDPSEAHSGNRS